MSLTKKTYTTHLPLSLQTFRLSKKSVWPYCCVIDQVLFPGRCLTSFLTQLTTPSEWPLFVGLHCAVATVSQSIHFKRQFLRMLQYCSSADCSLELHFEPLAHLWIFPCGYFQQHRHKAWQKYLLFSARDITYPENTYLIFGKAYPFIPSAKTSEWQHKFASAERYIAIFCKLATTQKSSECSGSQRLHIFSEEFIKSS